MPWIVDKFRRKYDERVGFSANFAKTVRHLNTGPDWLFDII